jgi:hypothetical protein
MAASGSGALSAAEGGLSARRAKAASGGGGSVAAAAGWRTFSARDGIGSENIAPGVSVKARLTRGTTWCSVQQIIHSLPA